MSTTTRRWFESESTDVGGKIRRKTTMKTGDAGNPDKKLSVEKLIEFFKSFQWKKPPKDQAEDDRRNQTEAEYQAEQAEWLETIKRKKHQDDNG
jgi:hypothetical protein